MTTSASAATANVYKIFGELRDHVTQKLASVGVQITDTVPYLAILQEVFRQQEPVRTRLMSELKTLTFNIASSHKFRVLWNRRPYMVGPVAQSFTLPVAIKILQHMAAENLRPAVAAGNTDIVPILLHWDNFQTKDGQTERPATSHDGIDAIRKGSTYQFWLAQHKLDKNYERRWGGTDLKPDLEAVFRARLPGAPTSAPQDYTEVSGSVLPGHRAATGMGTLPPGAVQTALTAGAPPPGAPPPPPPGAEG